MVKQKIFGYIKGHLGSVKTIKNINPCFRPLTTRAGHGKEKIMQRL